MIYNKLVRDKIPQIIAQNGGKAHTRILSPEDYHTYLKAKLDEEVGEFQKDNNLEELADIMEVVYALTQSLGCSRAELEALRQNKYDQRGGFEQRILLISSEK